MAKLPAISGKELVKFLEFMGFKIIRTKGSHARMKAEDGRITTIPVHGHRDIPKGLLRKIIREDLEMSLEAFIKEYQRYKRK